MFDLTGKMALVTGASGGIGGAIARAMHAQGAHVVLSGTREQALSELRAELGERASIAPADLATVRRWTGWWRRRRRRPAWSSTCWSPTPASPRTASSCG